MQEAQDSSEHSTTLPRDQCRNSCLLMIGVSPPFCDLDSDIRSPPPLALLSVPNFIPYGAALVTSPIGVPRDGCCQRPELL